jgi:hypothetical protein
VNWGRIVLIQGLTSLPLHIIFLSQIQLRLWYIAVIADFDRDPAHTIC